MQSTLVNDLSKFINIIALEVNILGYANWVTLVHEHKITLRKRLFPPPKRKGEKSKKVKVCCRLSSLYNERNTC